MPGTKKIVNIVSSISNGAGLEADSKLLFSLLESLGHKPRLIAYDRPYQGLNYSADLTIFLEVMVAGMLNYSPFNYFCPNSEWYDFHATESALPRINLVLCKTQDCEAIWGAKLGRTYYTGWEAADLSNNLPLDQKEKAFLHLAGNSGTKNTEAVIECWRQFAPPYPLLISARDPAIRTLCYGVPNVRYEQRLADSHIANFMNSYWFHLMPSQYEGYGQGMHEALGCGGIVLTTEAPPMTEFPGISAELMIPSTGTFIRRLATCHYVSAEGVRDAVMRAAALPTEQLAQLSRVARLGFESERDAFRERIKRLLEC